MAGIRKLASQTVYYGLSSILGRMLNYALVPLHTRVLFNQEDYGVMGVIYAYVTFLNILFLYGMETAFFRFASKSEDKKAVYQQSFSVVLLSSVLFTGIIMLLAPFILNYLNVQGNISLYRIEYIYIFAMIMGSDAITAIPFAKLRLDNRPLKFASIRIANITINVFLNIYFLLICPAIHSSDPQNILASFYTPTDLVYYIFLSQLIATLSTILLLYKEIIYVKIRIVWKDLKPMLIFSIPLLFAGLGGMINETLDRILLNHYLPGNIENRIAEIGIYNAAYKLSIFMTLAIQAFRMAAEPFFFSINKNADSKQVYAQVMNYFVLACTVIFIGVTMHMNIIQEIIGEGYREGLPVVPVLLLANLFLGIYLNLSIWYKVNDRTRYGAYITFIGAIITIALNILWIPIFGYMGSAYATLICYLSMMVICYFMGQKFYKVPYQTTLVLKYIGVMLLMYFVSIAYHHYFSGHSYWIAQAVDTFIFILFIFYAFSEMIKLRKTDKKSITI